MDPSPAPRELVALLAEPDRLRALAAVALGVSTRTEGTDRAGLEPRAAARALSRLVAGGLLEGEGGKGYRVRTDVLRTAAIPPDTDGSESAFGRHSTDSDRRPPVGPEDAVLRRFVHNGRLLSMPAARSKRLVVLDHLAGLFEPGRRYPEAEVNRLLERYHPDYAMLRRYLVDDGFLARADEPAPSGSRSVKVYWRTGGTVALETPPTSS
jgi:DNA-binding transcriptional ArsR family regulator